MGGEEKINIQDPQVKKYCNNTIITTTDTQNNTKYQYFLVKLEFLL